jgi:CHAD domain-containing protein
LPDKDLDQSFIQKGNMGTTTKAFAANGVNRRRAGSGAQLRRALPKNTLRLLGASLKFQWKRYRKRLSRCQNKFSEEAVHDSRVEARRLVSLLGLLGPFMAGGRARKIERMLKRHLDTFNDLHDTQVQALAVGKMLRSFPAVSAFHVYLLERERRLTRSTRKHIKRVKTRRLGKLIGSCVAEAEARRKKIAPKAAVAVITRTVHRAFMRTEQLKRRIDPRDAKTIHRTRIAFKRFRYMMEALAKYLPGADKKLLERMRYYQTMMGDIQDAEVLLQGLDKYLRKQALEPGRMRAFHQALLRRRQELIEAYLPVAGQLSEVWPG